MESEWGVSSIMTAVRLCVLPVLVSSTAEVRDPFLTPPPPPRPSPSSLPISVGGGAVFVLVIFFSTWPTLKIRMLVGSVLASVGSLLLIWADGPSWYWPLVVPGFVVGSLGVFPR